MTNASDQPCAKKLTTPIALTLCDEQEMIISHWVTRVQNEVRSAAKLSAPVLVDTLPVFLSNLAEALDEGHDRLTATDSNNVAQEHGGERARISDYGPDQVIQEYSILRQVVLQWLAKKHDIPHPAYLVIQKSFDEAIQQAMMAFYIVFNELRENVVANLTHDMRTPLSSIKLSVDLIGRKISRPLHEGSAAEVRILLNKALKNIDYMNDLIQSMLDDKRLKSVGHPEHNFF